MNQRIERTKRISTSIILGLFLLQIACQTLTGPRPTPPPPVSPATASPSTVLPPTTVPSTARPTTNDAPEAPPSGETDLACFGFFGYGVTCIENNEWVNYGKQNSALSGDLVKDIAICPGGEILVLNTAGINLFDGTNWRNYGQGWGHGSAEAVACNAYNDFWVAHYQGVSYFNDGIWQTYSVKETLSSNPEAYESVNDIAIAPDGTVWVVTVNSIAVFTKEKWTVYEEGTGFDDKYFFAKIALDSRAEPWVVSSSGLHHRNGMFWDFYPSVEYATPQSIAVDHQDRIWVGALSRGLLLFENESWLTFTPQNTAIASYNVSALAVDATGRIWVGTAWGLHVIDGEMWLSYQMSNSDLADDNIFAIAVAGDGPALPTARQKAPGAITGKLVNADGAPLANAALEVCIETIYSSYQGATPCEGHPYMRDTVSDADGVFKIENLPRGFYNLAIQTDETWILYTTRMRGVSERFLVSPGETTDLGEISIGAE